MPTTFETTILPGLLIDNKSGTNKELAMQAKEYRRQYPNEKIGGIFHKDVVLAIVNDPNCFGLRYYFGIDSTLGNAGEIRNPTVILCGVDANGNDIIKQSSNPERSWSCPPLCSVANVFNNDNLADALPG